MAPFHDSGNGANSPERDMQEIVAQHQPHSETAVRGIKLNRTEDLLSSDPVQSGSGAEESQDIRATSGEEPPDICHRVEYRQYKDGMLLLIKDITKDKKLIDVHQGPVFDVVQVNYTTETSDTQKTEQASSDQKEKTLAQGALASTTPSVHIRGRTHILIHSRAIINALQSVVNHYPRTDLVSQPVEIQWPYAILLHHKDELIRLNEQYQASDDGKDAIDCSLKDTSRHLSLLLDFLEDEMGDKVRAEKARWAQSPPTASFEMLWLLLKPGTDVYKHNEVDGSKEACVVSFVDFKVWDGAWDTYEIDAWYLDSDDTSIRPRVVTLKVDRFHGEKPIHELDLFPCEYHPQHVERRLEIIKRSKLGVSLKEKKCMYFEGESDETPRWTYKGYVMVDPAQQQEDDENEPIEESFIVDQKLSQLPLCSCSRCSAIEGERSRPAKFQGYKRIDFKDRNTMTDHQYFVFTNVASAFVLSIRRWKKLHLEGFKEPEWNLALMDSLVLKDSTKMMLRNLAHLYIKRKIAPPPRQLDSAPDRRPTARPWTADYIEDKGKGLVILLHGKPGVGKTYTAECIAHTMQRPLLSITCADIGVDPPTVETKLRRWFTIARRWDAVLLLDEADIYFESRQTQDLERNNLVASFLRAIEYYDGILFLTTNRIGTSDEAVWSRIHATIYYDDFTDEQRQKIWNTYFDKLDDERGEEIRVSEDAKEYVMDNKDVKDLKWNGREIRNAFQIAVNLAQAEDVRDKYGRFIVKRAHIKVTVDLLKSFGDYMSQLHKMSQSKRARINRNRDDDYTRGGAHDTEAY